MIFICLNTVDLPDSPVPMIHMSMVNKTCCVMYVYEIQCRGAIKVLCVLNNDFMSICSVLLCCAIVILMTEW